MGVLTALGVGHVDDLAAEPTQQVDPLLTVVQPVIFSGGDRSVENRFATHKVHSVVFDIQQPLWLVPGHHAFTVSTKSSGGNAVGNLASAARCPKPPARWVGGWVRDDARARWSPAFPTRLRAPQFLADRLAQHGLDRQAMLGVGGEGERGDLTLICSSALAQV